MKRLTTITAAVAAGLLMATTAAYAANTYSGTTVITQGLHAEARSVTDGKGNATFRNLKPDSYTFLLPDTSSLKPGTQLTFTITVTGMPSITGQVTLGKAGSPTYLTDKSGRKVVVALAKVGAGTLIIVNMSIFDRWGNL